MITTINDIEFLLNIKFTTTSSPSKETVEAMLQITENAFIEELNKSGIQVDVNNDYDKYVIRMFTAYTVSAMLLDALDKQNKLAAEFRQHAEDLFKKILVNKKPIYFKSGSNEWQVILDKIARNMN